jgi:hypothetical protein
MSTAAVSSNSLYQQLQTYFQTRQSDLQQLGQDLQNGDLTDAQQEFSAIQTLGQSGPFASGDAFRSSTRQQDFNAIGQALQSGNVSAAQQAFSQLESTFENRAGTTASPTAPTTPLAPVTQPVTSSLSNQSSGGSEIVINLGNLTPGEQITIGLNSESNGNEQVTVNVANEQNQNPEQITLNLNPNTNQEIVLNILNGSLFNTNSTAAQGSGLNVSA